MEYQKAVTILQKLLKKYSFTAEEKVALETAIGILAWVSLGKNRLKIRKAMIEKSTEW